MEDEIYLHSAAFYDQINTQMAESLAFNLISKLNKLGCNTHMKVLDIGCGTGTVINEFSEAGYSVCGIDPSHSMIAQAKKKYPKLEFDVGVPGEFLKDRDFDLIISTNDAINYLSPEDLYVMIASIRDSLRPGGFVYLDFTTETDFVQNWDNQRLEERFGNFQISRVWNFDPKSNVGRETQIWSVSTDQKEVSFKEIHTLFPIKPVLLAKHLEAHGLNILSFLEPVSMKEIDLDVYRYLRLGLVGKN